MLFADGKITSKKERFAFEKQSKKKATVAIFPFLPILLSWLGQETTRAHGKGLPACVFPPHGDAG